MEIEYSKGVGFNLFILTQRQDTIISFQCSWCSFYIGKTTKEKKKKGCLSRDMQMWYDAYSRYIWYGIIPVLSMLFLRWSESDCVPCWRSILGLSELRIYFRSWESPNLSSCERQRGPLTDLDIKEGSPDKGIWYQREEESVFREVEGESTWNNWLYSKWQELEVSREIEHSLHHEIK